MNRFLPLIVLLLHLSFNTFGQQRGTPDYLLVERGFSIFKLGAPITNYSNYFKISPHYEVSNEVYELTNTDSLPSATGIKIKRIELNVNHGLIESVIITVDKEYKDALLDILKANYGEGQSTDIDYKLWKSKDLKILLTYANKYESQDIGRAVFLHTSLAGDSAFTN